MTQLTLTDIWETLDEVHDPEIPVVSVVGLGMVREVAVAHDKVTVKLTPTFTGCPAYLVMAGAIVRALRNAGARSVKVETVLHPPWSTDWIGDDARAKLRASGLAVSDRHGGSIEQVLASTPGCPRCGSWETEVTSPFGATRCKSICVCRSCREPFEWIKPM